MAQSMNVDINKRRAAVAMQLLTEAETRAHLLDATEDDLEMIYIRQPLQLVPFQVMFMAPNPFGGNRLTGTEFAQYRRDAESLRRNISALMDALKGGFEVCVVRPETTGGDSYYRVVGGHCVKVIVSSDGLCDDDWRPENHRRAPSHYTEQSPAVSSGHVSGQQMEDEPARPPTTKRSRQ